MINFKPSDQAVSLRVECATFLTNTCNVPFVLNLVILFTLHFIKKRPTLQGTWTFPGVNWFAILQLYKKMWVTTTKLHVNTKFQKIGIW